MKVLSLFDGISCGRVALERAGILVEKYIAYEIDPYAVKISEKNFPSIEHYGDVFEGDFTQYKGFDLLLGGSPCTFWSSARKDNREVTPDGIGGRLFMQYVRALRESQCRYFLYENNFSINRDIKDFISNELGVQPIVIDSALVSSQSRKRCYWTNIPNVTQPEDKGIMLKDILLDDGIPIKTVKGKCNTFVASYYKIGENPFSCFCSERSRTRIALKVSSDDPRREGKRVYVVEGGECVKIIADDAEGMRLGPINLSDGEYIIRKLYPMEAETLQTLPKDYTKVDGVSDTNRYKGVGNGWTVDVIAHILKGLKEAVPEKPKVSVGGLFDLF